MKFETNIAINEFGLVAAPGAGKRDNTRMAIHYAKELRGDKIVVIETGEIFRGLKDKKPEFDHLVHLLNPDSYKKVISGDLVPDPEVIQIVSEIEKDPEFSDADKKIRDGFPRTVGQAEALDASNDNPRLFINLDVTDREALFRQNIRTVSEMLRMFEEEDIDSNVDILDCIHQRDEKRIKQLVEDYVETALDLGYIERDDARPATCEKRLKVYRDLTEPVLDYAAKTNRLIVIDAMRTHREVGIDFMKAIGYQEFPEYVKIHGFHPHPQHHTNGK